MNLWEECVTGVRPAVFEGASDESRERSTSVSLEGFSFSFRAKNEEWRDLQLMSRITFGSGKDYRFQSDQNNRTLVRF